MASVADILTSVSPDDRVAQVGCIAAYRVELVDGSAIAAFVVDAEATDEDRAALIRGATQRMAFGEDPLLLAFMGVDPNGLGFVARPVPTGTLRDLKALGWNLSKRLDLFTKVASAVGRFHGGSVLQGTITPEHVILNDELEPVLVGPALADPRVGLYSAPELMEGAPGGVRADIYSLGRLLHFLLLQEDPAPHEGGIPVLADLTRSPAGLSRIVRKCTARDPSLRYPGVTELLADVARYGNFKEVGLVHPDAKEENLSGLSTAPRPSKEALDAAKIAASIRVDRKSAPQVAVAAEPQKIEDISPRNFGIVMAVAAVLLVLLFSWPAIQRSLARGDLESSDLAARRKAVAAVMRLDRNFRGIDFSKMDFTGLNLVAAKFDNANLTAADFSDVDLSYASFNDATLKDAILLGADLRSARLANVSGLRDAVCDRTTKLPRGWECLGKTPQKTP